MMHQHNNTSGSSDNGSRHKGKGIDKPPTAAPLVQVKNSPAASPPSIKQILFRRRRTTDILLFIIGISACALSVLHIVWHSDKLPHSYHTQPSSKSIELPHLHLRGKSALQVKLDGFVARKAKEKESIRVAKNAAAAAQRGNTQSSKLKQNFSLLPKRKPHIPPIQVGNMNSTANQNDAQQPHENIDPAVVHHLLPPPQHKEGEPHPVAHLNCADHGGPTNQQIIDEMVFWSDIPSDSSYLSPMHPLNDPHTPDDIERFLTFEPDSGGWNNIRMAMETALVLSHAMGRTLVLPPEQRMYLIDKGKGEQQNAFSFNDFFHLDAISIEHKGFKVITMEEFLVRVASAGQLKDVHSQNITYPPGNETKWGGGGKSNVRPLWKYLRSVATTPEWDPWICPVAIPSSTDPQSILELNTTHRAIMDGSYGKPKPKLEEFNGHPTAVNATMAERMREMLADRENLCIYDKPLQEAKLIHLKVEKGVRLLTHFYAFIFFAGK
jgi:hypothetical protein